MRKRNSSHAYTWPVLTIVFIIIFVLQTYWVKTNRSSAGEMVLATSAALLSQGPSRYAYVFYVANDAYGCGALVNMACLREAEGGLPDSVDLIMVAKDGAVSSSILERAERELGAIIYPTSSFGQEAEMDAPIGGLSDYYYDCFLKFRAFLLPPEVYRRLILIDADSFIFNGPHHLFHLPDELPLAAPSAYWLRPSYVMVTNWLLSVRPSREIYTTLQHRLSELQSQGRSDIYDMDLFHIVFEKDITVLPPIYGMLDSEFIENDHDHLGPLDPMLNGTSVWAVHFSGGPKPIRTKVDPAHIANTHPHAHAGYARLMEAWTSVARRVCPAETLPI